MDSVVAWSEYAELKRLVRKHQASDNYLCDLLEKAQAAGETHVPIRTVALAMLAGRASV